MGVATKAAETICPEVKVGDFFVASWGYGQTNIDFLKVVSRTAKSVRLQPWTSKRVGESGIHNMVVPGDEPRMEWVWDRSDVTKEPVRMPAKVSLYRVSPSGYQGKAAVSWRSYAGAYHYTSNTPQYETMSEYGH